MRILVTTIIALLILSACKGKKVQISEEYIYFSKGFPTGLTIKLLKVYDFDEDGLPLNYLDSLRVDLNYSRMGDVKNKLFFKRDNKNYYWTFNLDSNYKTMPIDFEAGNWYGLWSEEFKDGFLKAEKFNYYLYLDSSGKFNVFEKAVKLNM